MPKRKGGPKMKKKSRELKLTNQSKLSMDKGDMINMQGGIGLIKCYACGIGEINSWNFKVAMAVEQVCGAPIDV
jgi:hypothetical protein